MRNKECSILKSQGCGKETRLRATEINQHLNSLFPDLKESTVDRVICGDPKAEVGGVAVAWMPYRETIERAKATGANVMVVHDPTFFDHWDLDAKELLPEAEERKAWIDNQGMTIIRCHDVWDALPEIGIPYAWGDYLGLWAASAITTCMRSPSSRRESSRDRWLRARNEITGTFL